MPGGGGPAHREAAPDPIHRGGAAYAGSVGRVISVRPPVDRLVFFTDAIVAIAATLLILPLVDEATTWFREDKAHTTSGFLGEARPGLIAFAISFVVIVRMWSAHHRLFARVVATDRHLITLDLFWALTIVFLPLPTQITALAGDDDRVAVGLYIGTMLASSVLMLLIALHLRRTPELVSDKPPIAGTVGFTLLFALALVLGVAFSSYFPLLILLLAGVVGRILEPRLEGTGMGAPAPSSSTEENP